MINLNAKRNDIPPLSEWEEGMEFEIVEDIGSFSIGYVYARVTDNNSLELCKDIGMSNRTGLAFLRYVVLEGDILRYSNNEAWRIRRVK